MCGILGSLNFGTDQKSFAEALKKLTARGPDDSGVYHDQYVSLGNTRLSIIDLDHGQQPIQNENGTVITVFNGEIYNYLELKAQLNKRGHVFKTNSDTEVLVHLYEEYGIKMAEHLDGMFAFAIWDYEKQKLLLVRDHFGKKPLVYYFRNNVLVFASEVKAILAFSALKQYLRVNQKSLIKYLFYGYVPSPHTIYDNIYKLRPATLIEFSLDKTTIHKKETCYWEPQNAVRFSPLRLQNILEELDHLITRAVQKRLMADVPLGAFLSGGIDSGLIVAHLSRFKSELKTFTVSYNEQDYDESIYATQTATHLNISNKQLKLTEAEVLSALPSILSYIDEPMADLSIVPSYFVSKFARNWVKVSLSGDGGDELFGGYLKYIAHKIVDVIQPLSYFFSKGSILLPLVLNAFIKNSDRKQANKMFFATLRLPLEIRNFLWTGGCFLPEELSQLLKGDFSYSLGEVFEDAFFYGQHYNENTFAPQKALYLDSRIQLPDWYLLKTDWASMANSLEVRTPLLDKKLAEMVFSIPFSLKIEGLKTKSLLKKFAQKYLPKEVIKQKKRGFGVPMGQWMRNNFKELVMDHLSGACLSTYFNKKQIENIYRDHLEQKTDNTQRLWRLIILENVLSKSKIS